MKEEIFDIIKRSELNDHQFGNKLSLSDHTRPWSDTTVEFTDPTGELLAIKREEKELEEKLYAEMHEKLDKFWDSKKETILAIDTEEIPQPIPF